MENGQLPCNKSTAVWTDSCTAPTVSQPAKRSLGKRVHSAALLSCSRAAQIDTLLWSAVISMTNLHTYIHQFEKNDKCITKLIIDSMAFISYHWMQFIQEHAITHVTDLIFFRLNPQIWIFKLNFTHRHKSPLCQFCEPGNPHPWDGQALPQLQVCSHSCKPIS